MYALHCGPLPVGTFAVMPSTGLPGQDQLRIELSGASANDDGQQLADLINEFSTIRCPQSLGEFRQLFKDLQTPAGPLARFVFVQSQLTTTDEGAEIRAWLRAWPDSRYAEIRNELRSAVDSLPDARITFAGEPFPAMVCSPELSAAAAHLRGVLGAHAVTVQHAAFPFNGEDFALFVQRVPGAMFILGVANPDAGHNGIPHSPDFAADEHAIGVGVRSMAGVSVKPNQPPFVNSNICP
ncbi:hypothetical protein [Streptomyces viridiviolaceus]|uniref:hypothetical protein n=1 Tax=Streptomyces viridiviolaceus TaxID=68282 RepID=UPI00357138FB